MKKLIKILSFSLVLIMCMSILSACGLFEPKSASELLTKSKESMSTIGNNYHVAMDVQFDIHADAAIMGTEIELDTPVQMQMDVDVANKYMRGDTKVAADIQSTVEYDQETKVTTESVKKSNEFYLVLKENNNEVVVYSDNDEKWQYQAIAVESIIADPQLFLSKDLFSNAAMNKDGENYVVTIQLADLFNNKTISDVIAKSFSDSEMEKMDLDSETIAKMVGDAVVFYTFDKQYRLIGISADKIALDVSALFNNITTEEIGLEGLSPNAISMNAEFSITLSKFGKIKTEDVQVPAPIVDIAIRADGDGPDSDADNTTDTNNEEQDDQQENAESNSESQDSSLIFSPDDISDDWRDMDVAIDGVVYSFPYDYDKLVENGWDLDMAEYGYDNGYILNPDDSIYSTVELTNKRYGDDWDAFTIWCGFKNYSESATDITECDLWSMELNMMGGWDPLDRYPDVQIAQGITFGSTKEDVFAAFGECEDSWEDVERGYQVFEYSYDYDKYLSLTIFDEYGVTAIEVKGYA